MIPDGTPYGIVGLVISLIGYYLLNIDGLLFSLLVALMMISFYLLALVLKKDLVEVVGE